MAYVATIWVNRTAPPLSAANLNKLTNEIEVQANNLGISHSLPNWADGVAPAITDAGPWNEIERVVQLVAQAKALTYTPTVWQAGWTPSRSAANLNKIEQQVATNSVTGGAPPLPPPTGPITITAGGTYTGNWVSTSSTIPAVQINTTAPVVIINSRAANSAGATIIKCQTGAVQVTVENTLIDGGAGGRFFQSEGFKSVTIRNCTIELSRGIELQQPVATATVLITRNRHHNIQGNGTSPVGNFVQLREVQNANPVEISWNEIVNEYNLSNPEDLISCYKSAHVRLHDNYFQHQSKPGNAYNTSSQNPITIENGDGIPPSSNDNIVTDNTIVDCVGGIGIFGGSNNSATGNRIVQDGKLPNGTQMGNGYEGGYIAPGGTNNHQHDNFMAFVNRDNQRQDGNYVGAPEGHAAEYALNTHPPTNTINAAMEANEWTLWQAKLTANGVSVGVGGGSTQ